VTRILSTTRRQKKNIQEEEELGHHIPHVLLNKATKLVHVQHRDELGRFGQLYKRTAFNDLSEEYEPVKESVSLLLGQFFAPQLKSIVERDMKASLAGRILDAGIRESFIHPYQVFLLGSIIIDKFYDSFREWYGADLCGVAETCLEAAWLLTSIFHDRAKKVSILKRALEVEIGEFGTKIPDEDAYLSLLSSFYNHISAGNTAGSWTAASQANQALVDIFRDYSDRWNHGVKGAVLMLRSLCKEPTIVLPRDVMSAFSIAVHDEEVWDALLTGGFFPLQTDSFPLACLLLQLDAVQEWGRQRVVNSETHLIGMSIKGSSVICDVSFESLKSLRDKDAECDKACRCVLSDGLNISLNMNIRKRLNK